MLKINNVGPSITTNANRATAKIMFVLDKYLIPLPNPDQAEIINNTVTTAIITTFTQYSFGIPKM